MTALQHLGKVTAKAAEVKKALTASYFSGDKSYYNELLAQYPAYFSATSVYETINGLSAKVARETNFAA